MSEFAHPESADNPAGLQLPRGNDYTNVFRRMSIEQRAKRTMKRQLAALPACKNDKGKPESFKQVVWRQQRRSRNPAIRLLLDEDAPPVQNPDEPGQGQPDIDYSDYSYDTDYADEHDSHYDEQDLADSGKLRRSYVNFGIGALLVAGVATGGYLMAHAEDVLEPASPGLEQTIDYTTSGSDLNPDMPSSLPGPADYSLPRAP